MNLNILAEVEHQRRGHGNRSTGFLVRINFFLLAKIVKQLIDQSGLRIEQQIKMNLQIGKSGFLQVIFDIRGVIAFYETVCFIPWGPIFGDQLDSLEGVCNLVDRPLDLNLRVIFFQLGESADNKRIGTGNKDSDEEGNYSTDDTCCFGEYAQIFNFHNNRHSCMRLVPLACSEKMSGHSSNCPESSFCSTQGSLKNVHKSGRLQTGQMSVN